MEYFNDLDGPQSFPTSPDPVPPPDPLQPPEMESNSEATIVQPSRTAVVTVQNGEKIMDIEKNSRKRRYESRLALKSSKRCKMD